MDIEGSERKAIEGAKDALRRWRPRLAICAYHLEDDPRVIPATVRAINSNYEMHVKDVDIIGTRVTPKVLFFY